MIHWTLSEAWLHALGWALLHSLWQMALLAILGGLGLRLMKGRLPASRQYIFIMLLIGFSALLFAGTVYLQFGHYQEQALAPQLNIASEGTAMRSAAEEKASSAFPQNAISSRFASVRDALEGQLFWLVALWLLGVLLLSIRQVGHYFFLSQLRLHGLQAPKKRWAKLFERLVQKTGLQRPIIFLESTLAKDMMAFGHWRPYILAPVGLLAGLPPEQVEALLLHELAHIKRHDYLIRLLQSIVETLLFYHPAIWWLSYKAGQLREESCDEQVLAWGTQRTDYAEALLQAARFSKPSKYQFAMNASSHFTTRIKKMLSTSTPLYKNRFSKAFSWAFALLIFISLTAFSGFVLSAQHTVSVAADKMNVLYLGVDNPLTIAVAGIPSERVSVSSEKVEFIFLGEGRYIARPLEEGEASIRVSGPGFGENSVPFRVKRLPDPVARLNGSTGGSMSAEEFRATKGVKASLGIDFDIECPITGYHMVHVPKNGDPVEIVNRQGPFRDLSAKLAQMAEKGSIYYFDEVKCLCPGDEESRKINAMVFKIR